MNIKDERVLDVQSGADREGQDVLAWKKHNGLNQRWKILYLDEKADEPTSGLDKESGFYLNRPFRFYSRLPQKRVLTVHGQHGHILVIRKMKADDKNQQFYFDHLSRTIKSKSYKGYSIDMGKQSSGKGKNPVVW